VTVLRKTMPLTNYSQEDFFIVPSILREFLSLSFQAMDEPLFVSSRRRLILIQDLVAEVKTALPQIHIQLRKTYLPVPPQGACLDDLNLSVRSRNCLIRLGIMDDARLIGALTFGELLATPNFGVKSLVELLIAIEFANFYFEPNYSTGSHHNDELRGLDLQTNNQLNNRLTSEDILHIKECMNNCLHIPYSLRRKLFPTLSDNFKFDRETLKNRTFNCLVEADFINNPQKLSNHTIEELLNLPGFGINSLLDLLNAVESYLSSPIETPTEDFELIEMLVSEAKLLEQMHYADSISADDVRLGQFVRLINPSAQNALDAAETLDGEHIPHNIEMVINHIRELRNKVEEFSNLKLEDEILSVLSFVKLKGTWIFSFSVTD